MVMPPRSRQHYTYTMPINNKWIRSDQTPAGIRNEPEFEIKFSETFEMIYTWVDMEVTLTLTLTLTLTHLGRHGERGQVDCQRGPWRRHQQPVSQALRRGQGVPARRGPDRPLP